MLSKQVSININELAEAIRQRYGYGAVSIDKIFAGARLTDMKTVGLGLGDILDMQITVREKEDTEFLELIKDMEEIKEAAEELIEERKEKTMNTNLFNEVAVRLCRNLYLNIENMKAFFEREKEKKESIKEMEVRYPFIFYKEKYSGLLTMTKGDMNVAIDIWYPQPASKENDNISDADFAQKILEKWDNEPAFQLRENMKLIPKNGK